MKRRLMCLVFILFVMSMQVVNALEGDGGKILYLTTGNPNQVIPRTILKGFEDGLSDKYEVYVEYLGNIGSEIGKYTEQDKACFRETIRLKNMRYGKFDKIVCVGDVAGSMLLDNFDMFDKERVMLLNLYNENVIDVAFEYGVSVITMQSTLLQENLDMIVSMYGNKRTIKVITGPSNSNKKLIGELNTLKEKYLGEGVKIETRPLSYTSKEELETVARSLDKEKDVVLFMDPTSELMVTGSAKEYEELKGIKSLNDVVKLMSKSTRAPIYSNIDITITAGMNGGVYTDLYQLGNDIVEYIEYSDEYKGSRVIEVNNKQHVNVQKAFFSGVAYEKLPKKAIKLISNSVSGVYKYETHILVLMVIIAGSIGVVLWILSKLEREKERVQELSLLKDKAEQVNDIKDRLMNNISHELRTPVTVIASSSQLLKRTYVKEVEDNKKVIGTLDIINRNALRLMRLINNVIDISNAESETLTTEKENIDIVSLIEDSVMSVVPFANKKKLDLVFDTEVEELIMGVDIDKMDRIVLNLLSNAIKFTNEGGRIMVYISVKDNNLILEVTDTGIGIEEEKKNIIFDKFTQIDTKNTRLNEGSGVGLAIVKAFVSLHEGTINVTSQINIGTTIAIKIPIQLVENKEAKLFVERKEMNTESELADIYL